jgi:hypothetical protein
MFWQPIFFKAIIIVCYAKKKFAFVEKVFVIGDLNGI